MIRTNGVATRITEAAANDALKPCVASSAPNVADVVLILAMTPAGVVEPPGVNLTTPRTSQSPGVSETLVQLAAAADVSDVAAVVAERYSPTLPAAALPPEIVPTMFGAVIVGVSENTADPEPVSSLRTPASCELVVDAN